MNHDIVTLIDTCIRLKHELVLLTPIIPLLDPSRSPDRTAAGKVTPLTRKRFREKWEQLGGWERIKREYFRQEKDLKGRLSDLAELLEEEGFDIERFKPGLSREQFFWLHSQKGEIKKHLRGVAIGP